MSQVHKTVAAAVLEEIAKPLKVFGEIQHKARKATEALVRIISLLPQVCFLSIRLKYGWSETYTKADSYLAR